MATFAFVSWSKTESSRVSVYQHELVWTTGQPLTHLCLFSMVLEETSETKLRLKWNTRISIPSLLSYERASLSIKNDSFHSTITPLWYHFLRLWYQYSRFGRIWSPLLWFNPCKNSDSNSSYQNTRQTTARAPSLLLAKTNALMRTFALIKQFNKNTCHLLMMNLPEIIRLKLILPARKKTEAKK